MISHISIRVGLLTATLYDCFLSMVQCWTSPQVFDFADTEGAPKDAVVWLSAKPEFPEGLQSPDLFFRTPLNGHLSQPCAVTKKPSFSISGEELQVFWLASESTRKVLIC